MTQICMAPLTQLWWKSCCWTKNNLAFAIQKIGHRGKISKHLLIRPSAVLGPFSHDQCCVLLDVKSYQN